MYKETESEIEIIAKAIKGKKELAITIYTDWDGFQTETFQPMVTGSDALGFPFAWGYMPEGKCYYKFYTDMITEIEETGKRFQIMDDARYLEKDGGYIHEKAEELLVV